ncbi:hypothetical protein BX600DRAFT_431011 [Xylariales sp. PMI_506]|nr:hypothetical protein BX600DRAFT_431011 [Xylariales sp. PMI_506]
MGELPRIPRLSLPTSASGNEKRVNKTRRVSKAELEQSQTQSSPIAANSRGLTPERPQRRRASSGGSNGGVENERGKRRLSSQGSDGNNPEERDRKRHSNRKPSDELCSLRGLSEEADAPSTGGDRTPEIDTPCRRPAALRRSTASYPSRVSSKPALPTRSQSDGSRDVLTPDAIDQNIERILKSKLPPLETTTKDWGYNYVLSVEQQNDEIEELLKVGHTTTTIQRRARNIKCQKARQIQDPENPASPPIRLHARAELLIKNELDNFVRPFWCIACRQTHKEYFTAPRHVVFEVTRRWRSFCALEPYDERGELRPMWLHRLQQIRRCGKEEKVDDHAERARRWAGFSETTRADELRYYAWVAASCALPFRWLFVAYLEALVIWILSPSQSRCAVGWLVLLGLLSLAEMLYSDMTLRMASTSSTNPGRRFPVANKTKGDELEFAHGSHKEDDTASSVVAAATAAGAGAGATDDDGDDDNNDGDGDVDDDNDDESDKNDDCQPPDPESVDGEVFVEREADNSPASSQYRTELEGLGTMDLAAATKHGESCITVYKVRRSRSSRKSGQSPEDAIPISESED